MRCPPRERTRGGTGNQVFLEACNMFDMNPSTIRILSSIPPYIGWLARKNMSSKSTHARHTSNPSKVPCESLI